MDLFESIYKRKSCRNYTTQPLSQEQLDEIRAVIESFEPLYPDLPLKHRFVTETKGIFHIQAPHYLIVSGEGQAGELENAGFLFQQLMLWFAAHDIGSVWLGKAKDTGPSQSHKDLITIAFGKTNGTVHRSRSEFKRKPIAEITNAPEDACIQAVHLAPSGMNSQPWYLEKTESRVLLYKQNLKPPLSMLYKKEMVDIGIALCHYAVACKHFGKPFVFHRKPVGAKKKGYQLYGELN